MDAWPAISHEQRPWTLGPEVTLARSARRRHTGPFEAAVTPRIAAIEDLGLDHATLALTDEASTEIARFDEELGDDIAPFSALLLRSESAASSQIEHLTASAKAIALAELGDPSKHNAGIIVANTRAMEAAISLADSLDEQAILAMHEILLGGQHPDWVGHWREQQVWVGGSRWGPHGALFVPPTARRVPTAMADLVAFMRRDDLPVLAQAALAHAQFETIHPFPDGNGRTGRSLIHALLRAKHLTRNLTIPVSAGLLTDTEAYFNALTAYREGRSIPIVAQLAEASFSAIDNARRLVHDLRAARTAWTRRLHARRGAAAWTILERLTSQPVVDSPLLQRDLGLSAPTVNGAIASLVDAGILTKVSGQHRNRKWAAIDVLDALDEFARRGGRRSTASG